MGDYAQLAAVCPGCFEDVDMQFHGESTDGEYLWICPVCENMTTTTPTRRSLGEDS